MGRKIDLINFALLKTDNKKDLFLTSHTCGGRVRGGGVAYSFFFLKKCFQVESFFSNTPPPYTKKNIIMYAIIPLVISVSLRSDLAMTSTENRLSN